MKGSYEITDMVAILAIAVSFIVLWTSIPKIWKEFFDEVALATSKVVAHDLSGIISISAAAPQDILISYKGNLKSINYTVDLKERKMEVEMLIDGKPTGEKSTNLYAVGSFDRHIENCNFFTASKTRNNLDSTFDFWCVE
jgi:hypothetical protein